MKKVSNQHLEEEMKFDASVNMFTSGKKKTLEKNFDDKTTQETKIYDHARFDTLIKEKEDRILNIKANQTNINKERVDAEKTKTEYDKLISQISEKERRIRDLNYNVTTKTTQESNYQRTVQSYKDNESSQLSSRAEYERCLNQYIIEKNRLEAELRAKQNQK